MKIVIPVAGSLWADLLFCLITIYHRLVAITNDTARPTLGRMATPSE